MTRVYVGYIKTAYLDINVEFNQLFFLDPEPAAVDVPDLLYTHTSHGDVSDHEVEAAWIDSDDERLVVSLASNPRLRKLRVTEAEDVINGKEYTKRLRRQFEMLYPVPDWVKPSAGEGETHRNRKGRSRFSATSEEDTANDTFVEADQLLTQPLATLLQNASSIIQPRSTALSSRKNLRPEFIDVHRLKDVGKTQPVSISITDIS